MEKRQRYIDVLTEFGFGYLEAHLANAAIVDSPHRTAFAHRIKNLLKLGDKVGLKFGVGRGAGRATLYGLEDMGLLGVALELTQLGIPPERAMLLIKKFEHTVLFVLTLACDMFAGCPDRYAHRKDNEAPPPQVLMWTDPRVLTMTMAEDPAFTEEFVDYGTVQDFMKQVKDMDYATPRFAVFNVTSLISLLSMEGTSKHPAELAEKMHYALVTILHERGETQIKHLRVNRRGDSK